ncbi:MAG: prephenate dehydratase [Bacteroidales bacterium]|jgi:prephenate dehydratase|nr:prephenate dehydratase [Bacteroidales bacterium]MBR6277805.1 prephenate dehydratase [Bacteroidales bacterium]MCR4559362.1 prephenate dehydratase [Bacteroidales bacterium]
MKVAIQGVKGAFHEIAARKYFEDRNDLEIVEKLTFEDVVESVANYETAYGVIAIENALSGTINVNLELIRKNDVKICGEIFIRIKQNLAANKGVKIEDLKEVHSHYMAINQTRQFFRKYPHIKLVECASTAVGLREVAQTQSTTIGAVGSDYAIELNNLEILAPGIETNSRNYTRFVIIRPKNEENPSTYDKASLNIVLENEQGSLSKILSIISIYDVDLTKIESMPLMGQPMNYMFYIDVKFKDIMRYKNMLTAIRPLLRDLSILGEYKEGYQSWREVHNN